MTASPEKHRILAIDPGVTTGICFGELDVAEQSLKLTFDEKRFTIGEFYEYVRSHVSLARPHIHLIYESFEYRNVARTGLNLTPVKLIGVIELLEEWYSDKDVKFYMQSAATGKAFFRDDRLKSIGAYAVGNKHSRDATRHLLQWLAFGAGSQYAEFDKLTVST